MPAIERTGTVGPPQLDNEDRFSFGGAPLIPIGQVTSSACPTAGCTETMPAWAVGAWYFRLEREGSFTRFFRMADDETWRAQAPSGLSMEFGRPVTAATAFSPSDTGALDVQSGTNVRWNLVRVYDAAAGSPVNVVVYGWRHQPLSTPGLTIRGVLTDIFDTPEIGSPGDLDGYAHHARIRYEPHNFPFRHHAKAWQAMPAFRVAGVDVSAAGRSGGPREMLRRYEMRYSEIGDGHVVGRSHLRRITQEGRCEEPVLEDVTYERGTYTASLPASTCPKLPGVNFDYTPEVPDTPRPFRQISINPPAPGDPEVSDPLSGSLAFEDVNSDGLIDIIETRSTNPLDKILYLTERHFLSTSVRPTPLAFQPGSSPPGSFLDSSAGLSLPGMWKTGTRGDVLWRPTDPAPGGTAPHYLVHVDGHQSGHWTYLRDTNVAGTFRRPHLAGDLDGDGLVDAFHEENELCFSTRNFPSYTISAFAYPGSVHCITSDPISIGVGINAPVLASLADFNADGVLDYVVSRPSITGSPPAVTGAQPLQYYPGTGTRFNCLSGDGSCTRFPSACNPNSNTCHSYVLLKKESGQNLHFDPINDPALILYGDVTGDGYADMVEVRDEAGRTVVDLQRNLDGQRFFADPRVELPHAPGLAAPRATLADVDGSGVVSLVLAYQDGTIAFYDWHRENLHDAPRPGLLASMRNAYGAKTTFSYSTIADVEASFNDDSGHPWAAEGPWGRHSPSSFPVIDKVTVSNGLPAPVGVTTTTTFDYREPVYDNWQNRFLGFRKSRVTQVGDSTLPSLATDTTYWFDRCPGRDGSLFCPETTEGFAYSAILGAPILIEQLDPDSGTPFSTTHLTYRNTTQLLMGADTRRVRYGYVAQADTWLYNTSAPPSGASSVLMLDIEDTQEHLSSVPIRSADGTEHLRTRQTRDWNGNVLQAWDDGRVDSAGAALDNPILTDSVPSLVGAPSDWIWRTTERRVRYDGGPPRLGPDPFMRSATFQFDAVGRIKRETLNLVGTLPLQRSHEDPLRDVAPPPSNASVDGAVVVARYDYDAGGRVAEVQGPTGECETLTYAGSSTRLSAAATHKGGCGSPDGFVALFSFDEVLGLPTVITGWDGTSTEFKYDAFGRRTETWEPHGSLSGTRVLTQRVTYDAAPRNPAQKVKIESFGGGDVVESWAYLDGFGSTVLTLQQADPSAGDAGSWIVSGLGSRNARGSVWKTFEPWFYSGDPATHPLSPAGGEVGHVVRDGLGRAKEAFRGSVLSRRVNHFALGMESWDAENLDSTSPHYGLVTRTTFDGHGRASEVTKETSAGYERTTVGHTATGQVNAVLRSASATAETYFRWMRFDSMGRLVENAEPHTTANFTRNAAASGGMQGWRYAYDNAGRLVGTSDARGCGKNVHHDALGRLLAEDYSPCLEHHDLYTAPDLATGDGTELFNRYDAPEADQPAPYGTEPFLGRLASTSDRGGHSRVSYDLRGRVTGQQRRIVKPGPPQAALADRYALHWFNSWKDYDGFDRLTTSSTGAESPELQGEFGASTTQFAYSTRGVIRQIYGSYGTLVASAHMKADGRPDNEVLGDTASTTITYGYDGLRRLTSVQVGRVSPAIWDSPTGPYTSPPTQNRQEILDNLTLGLDEVGNIKTVTDGRPDADWPAGSKPANKAIEYDSNYRLAHVTYAYSGGTVDTHVSPFQKEETTSDARPLPALIRTHRPTYHHYQYDTLGNIVYGTEDSNAHFDRSMGVQQHGSADDKPNRLDYASDGTSQTALSYDFAGNVTRVQLERDGACSGPTNQCNQLFAYEWDEVNQLSRARRWDLPPVSMPLPPFVPATSPTADLRYRYGGGSVRALKEYHDTAGTPVYTAEVFDSLRLTSTTYDEVGNDYAQNADTETVTLAGGVARLLYSATPLPLPAGPPSGASLHVLLKVPDPLGSASSIIDKETSELVERVSYQPYGATDSDYRSERWADFRETHRFTGKEDDIEVGLTYFGARYYSAHLGRWMSADPLTVHAAGADLNPYAYVSGRVFNAVDPLGLDVPGMQSDCEMAGNCPQSPLDMPEPGAPPGTVGPPGADLPGGGISLPFPLLIGGGLALIVGGVCLAVCDGGGDDGGGNRGTGTFRAVPSPTPQEATKKLLSNLPNLFSGAASGQRSAPIGPSAGLDIAAGFVDGIMRHGYGIPGPGMLWTWAGGAAPNNFNGQLGGGIAFGTSMVGPGAIAGIERAAAAGVEKAAVAAIETVVDSATGPGAAGPKQITTVIGRMSDLGKFAGDPAIDTWAKSGRIPGPGDKPVTWLENAKWLMDRVARGDKFGIATDPATLPPVKGGYIPGTPNGYFTARELDFLRGLGIEPIPMH